MPFETGSVEHRLHPASIVFWLAGQARRLVLPIIVGGVGASQWGLTWPVVVGAIFLPITVYSVVRYRTFRYRFEEKELVVRTGLVFRQVRTIPYTRIQNLDAVQGVVQRLLGVVDVQIQTGGGTEPEARMSVIPAAAVPELRERVFAGRRRAGDADRAVAGATPSVPGATSAAPARSPAGDVLLHLPPRELLIYGLIQNRGMIVIAAGLGFAWELGLLENLAAGAIWNSAWFQGVFRDAVGAAGVMAALAALTVLSAAIVGLLVFARLLSMAWAFVRLHDFTISRVGEDLRTTFGLLTRVSATIPLRRIQKLTIQESPFHRLAGRAAVRVDTAGGSKYDESKEAHRQWLAPLIAKERLDAFVDDVLPELNFARVHWEPVAPGAFRRVAKRSLIVATLASIPFFVLLQFGGLFVFALLGTWAVVYARKYVDSLGWAVTNGAVLFRSGWLWRRISVARFAKIQVVSVRETPWDRRRDMARVRVDTAGAGAASHAVYIPYLQAPRARELSAALVEQAARTTFRW
ncbi:MAG: PH domain-containing protein [Gemmatimonadota bacterium]